MAKLCLIEASYRPFGVVTEMRKATLNKGIRWILLTGLLLAAGACADGGGYYYPYGPAVPAPTYNYRYYPDYYGPSYYPEQDPEYWRTWQDRQGGGG